MKNEPYGYVYYIQNIETNRFYIGQTVNFDKRFHEHLTGKGSKPLFRAIIRQRGYGFKFFIINECFNKTSLDMHEAYYIQSKQATSYGYNISAGNCPVPYSFKPNTFTPYQVFPEVDHLYYERLEFIQLHRLTYKRERLLADNPYLDALFANTDEDLATHFPPFPRWNDILTYINTNHSLT